MNRKIKTGNIFRRPAVLFLPVFLLGLLVSCENFMNGQGIKDAVKAASDYSKAPYLTIQIKADESSTSSIVPAANRYESMYKKGDSIQLVFEPKEFIDFVGQPSLMKPQKQ